MTAQNLLARLSQAQRLQAEHGWSTAAALTHVWYGTTPPATAPHAGHQAPYVETLDELLERLVQRYRGGE